MFFYGNWFVRPFGSAAPQPCVADGASGPCAATRVLLRWALGSLHGCSCTPAMQQGRVPSCSRPPRSAACQPHSASCLPFCHAATASTAPATSTLPQRWGAKGRGLVARQGEPAGVHDGQWWCQAPPTRRPWQPPCVRLASNSAFHTRAPHVCTYSEHVDHRSTHTPCRPLPPSLCPVQAARQLGKPQEETNLIICHLGAGSSMCAVKVRGSVCASLSPPPCCAGGLLSARKGVGRTEGGCCNLTRPPTLRRGSLPLTCARSINHECVGHSVPSIHQSIDCRLLQGGKSVDTTMGLTPLEGLMMGTRCGGWVGGRAVAQVGGWTGGYRLAGMPYRFPPQRFPPGSGASLHSDDPHLPAT